MKTIQVFFLCFSMFWIGYYMSESNHEKEQQIKVKELKQTKDTIK